jgi:hypothetical protein
VILAFIFFFSSFVIIIFIYNIFVGLDFTLYLNFEKIHQFMMVSGEQMKKDMASRPGGLFVATKEEAFYKESTEIVC